MSPSDSQSGLRLQLRFSRAPAVATASDEDVMHGLIDREEWAAVMLWKRYAGLVYRMAERVLGSAREADAVVEDVFGCAFDKVPALRNPGTLRSLLVSVTIRTIKRRLRRMGSHSCTCLPDADESLRRFYRLLDRLPVDDRVAFVLRRVDGMSVDGVAEATGDSLAKVKRRLVRCERQLARSIVRDPHLMAFVAPHGQPL